MSARHESAPALHRWFAGYATQIARHHEIADTIVFPALLARVPTFVECAPALDADHRLVDELAAAAGSTLRRLTEPTPSWDDDHAAAVAQTAELEQLFADHLDDEERDVLAVLERHFSADECAALDERVGRAVTTTPGGFALPWLSATVDPDVGRSLAALAPMPARLAQPARRRTYRRLVAGAFGARWPTTPAGAPAPLTP